MIPLKGLHVVVGSLDQLGTVTAFEPSDGEVAPGDVLKMIDEDTVDQGTTHRPHHGHGLGRQFLRHGDAKARRHLGHEPDDRGSALPDNPSLPKVPRRLGHGFREARTYRKVACCHRVVTL